MRTNHPFYGLSPIIQWLVALSFLLIIGLFLLIWVSLLYRPLIYCLMFFVLTPIFQFLFTPLGKLTGMYTYLSPMLLVFGATKEKYDLHLGTSFDIWWVMRGVPAGRPWRMATLAYILKGLLTIIDRIESGALPPTIKITGSSYFFSNRTAAKLGFKTSKASTFVVVNIIFNYIDLFWMYSVASGSIRLPQLTNIKMAETTGAQLVAHKTKIQTLYHRVSLSFGQNHP